MTEEEKRAAKAEKLAAKQEKEAERVKKAEDDRLAREEQRKSREVPVPDTTGDGAVATSQNNDDLYEDPTPTADVQHTSGKESTDPTSPTSPISPTSPTSPGSSKGFKSLISKLRRRSRHAPTTETDDKTKEKEEGFIGGAALRTSTSHGNSQSQTSKTTRRPSHESIEAPNTTEAHRPTNLGSVEPAHVPHVDSERYSDVSSLSSDGEEYTVARGRTPKRVVSGGTTTSGGTDYEEALDHFDEDLAPPPAFSSDADKARKGSPSRESRFQEVGI
jgi:hypothetical protein